MKTLLVALLAGALSPGDGPVVLGALLIFQGLTE